MLNLTIFSKRKILDTFEIWMVQDEHTECLYNYLVLGFEPGGFWTSVLANNFIDAISHCHPANRLADIKDTVGWIIEFMPQDGWGNYNHVKQWVALSDAERRTILEQHELIYTEKEETWLALSEEYNEVTI